MMERKTCPTCGNKAISQQRDWQLKQIELGNCTRCGKPNDRKPKRQCETCRLKANAERRAYDKRKRKEAKR